MPKIVEISLKPHECLELEDMRRAVRQQFGIEEEPIVILKKSLDARSRKNIHFKVRASIGERETDSEVGYEMAEASQQSCHIIGFGPAGIFAALELLSLGIKPIVIERGKTVKERRRDLAAINKQLIVNEDSNYCFGEGGAGTYSDGKLYTRSKKKGDIQKVLKAFVQFGANANILYEAHPHIGTNKLPAIIEQMRHFILANGGEVHFESRLTDFTLKDGDIQSICINETEEMPVEQLILATGHSSRDIFSLLQVKGVQQELKPFALGVRIEHPQTMIDEMQYHCNRGDYLPPASYSLVNQVGGRGVFSFCMCPGGIIAPSSTAPGETVVNGWSPSKRNGKFANSGMVVQLLEKDFVSYQSHKELAGMAFQKEIEQTCFNATGSIIAPAQGVADFIEGKLSKQLKGTSYVPGVKSIDLREVLPAFIHIALRDGLTNFGKKMKGYDSNEGVLVATESRTSSPVRIPRDKVSMEHVSISNLYPCGEGAGYAGGIVSAALDGIQCAQAVKSKVR